MPIRPTPARPTPRAVRLENAAFLRALGRTGNAHDAARRLGLSRSRFTRRHAADPAFAARWDAALALAQASLVNMSAPGTMSARSAERAPHIVRRRDGTVQVRRRPATAITPAAEHAFLAALSSTANVRLAATAAGFSHPSFYARKRANPAFAREWRLALEQGYTQVEAALLASWNEDSAEHDAWRHNDPPPVPPMTVNQALQLLYLHQKEVLGFQESPHTKRRRGESGAMHRMRLIAMSQASDERARQTYNIAQALRAQPATAPRSPHEPPPPVLPDLAQVAGGGAAPVQKYHDKRALFGGWRLEDWKKRDG